MEAPSNIIRYARTLRLFWSASLMAEMEYRANFAFAAMGSVLTLAGALATLAVLYQHGYEMGGWAWPEAMLVVAIYTLLDGLQRALLAPNRQAISDHVHNGTLDFVLLKPLDAQFWLSARHLSVWGLPDVLLGLVLIGYAGSKLETPAGASSYLAGLLPLCFGVVILYALGFALATLTIWVTKAGNITIAMQALLEAGRYPVPAYAALYRVAFTFVLPVAFMTTVPAAVVTGRSGGAWVAASGAVALALLLGCRGFWRFALRSYSSASS